jgi:quercetin dioxygenase-like cupin family protein
MRSYKVDFAALPWESPMAGVRQKVHRQEGRQIRLVEYSKQMPAHWCQKGHTGYVLAGQMQLQFDHEAQIYSPGDGVCIPDGREHQHRGQVLTDTVTIIFVEDL